MDLTKLSQAIEAFNVLKGVSKSYAFKTKEGDHVKRSIEVLEEYLIAPEPTGDVAGLLDNLGDCMVSKQKQCDETSDKFYPMSSSDFDGMEDVLQDLRTAIAALQSERETFETRMHDNAIAFDLAKERADNAESERDELRGLMRELVPHVAEMEDAGYVDTPEQVYYATRCKICSTEYTSRPIEKEAEVWKCTNPKCSAVRVRKAVEST